MNEANRRPSPILDARAAAKRGTRVWGTRMLRRGALLVAVSIATACATTPVPLHLPPVSPVPNERISVGKWVWVDLVTQDVAAAQSFYGTLFGWTFHENGRYTQVFRDDTMIAGIVPARDPDDGSWWFGNLSVEDVDRAAELVGLKGGIVEAGPIDAPDRGRISLVSDPEGAGLLLVRASTGDPPDVEASMRGWLWWELWCHDVDASSLLYEQLAGYESETVEHEGHPYRLLKDGDRPRAGIVEAPPDVPALWLPYIRVEDAEATAKLAADLGARIFSQDTERAILIDPTGAPIGIQEWAATDANPEGGEEAR